MAKHIRRVTVFVLAASMLGAAVGCGSEEIGPPRDDVQVSTAIPGEGGTGQDYGEIRLVLELSIDAVRENDQAAFEKTQCTKLRRPALEVAPSGSKGSRFDGVLGDMRVDKVANIRVDGDRATADLTVTSEGRAETSKVNLVKETEGWLIC